MLADSLIVPECVYRPGSFTGLMTLYESNYIKLTKLIELPAAQQPTRLRSAVSTSIQDCDLHLDWVSRARYTTTIRLTYWFPDPSCPSSDTNVSADDRVADPNLTVRIYHDARLVEAVSGTPTHRHDKLREWAAQALGELHWHELDRRWRHNIMLNKWLDYLLESGHGFSEPVPEAPSDMT